MIFYTCYTGNLGDFSYGRPCEDTGRKCGRIPYRIRGIGNCPRRHFLLRHELGWAEGVVVLVVVMLDEEVLAKLVGGVASGTTICMIGIRGGVVGGGVLFRVGRLASRRTGPFGATAAGSIGMGGGNSSPSISGVLEGLDTTTSSCSESGIASIISERHSLAIS